MLSVLRCLRSALIVAMAWASFPAHAAAPVSGAQPGEEHCVVNLAATDALNLRDGPSASARVVAVRQYGACRIVVTDACRSGWCPAETGRHKGWVNERFISMVSPARYCVTGVAAGDALNLRAYPSARSRVLHRLSRNECGVAFLPYAKGGWQKIRAGGQEGWVKKRYLSGQ